MHERPNRDPSLAGLIFGGGLSCILGSLFLGLYVAHASSQLASLNTRERREVVGQNLSAGVKTYNVNVPTWQVPGPVTGIMWAGFGVGCFLVLSGLKANQVSRNEDFSAKRPMPEI